MIEIEIKCHLQSDQEQKLLKHAVFVKQEVFTDVYYDSARFELSSKDYWLRTRNGVFMLKVPATQADLFAAQKNTPKHELSDETQIRELLNLSSTLPLEDAAQAAGYMPLYRFTNTRRKYHKDGLVIDLDHADFGDYTYDLCEIETVVEDASRIAEAQQKIHAFAHQFGIVTDKPILGKLIYHIKRVNPEHYRVLNEAFARRLKA
jgi:predicted adenylyl cyclase CyaB